MLKLIITSLIVFSQQSFAAYSNYNSILIGEKAAGMGGAYTALSGDTSAGPYYNPASLSRMHGTSLSTTANLYIKPDITYTKPVDFSTASLRVNKGSIQPVPASSGTVHTFGNFAFGLSVLLPDYYQYVGSVESTSTTSSFVNVRDESLWIGGAIALNISEKESLGFSGYYTSRTFTRSVVDSDPTNKILTTEEKEFTHNALIYVLGYYKEFKQHWHFGVSHRFESLPISGEGSVFENTFDGTSFVSSSHKDLDAFTLIPAKTTFGIAYEVVKKWTLSADLSLYEGTSYKDFGDNSFSDNIIHKPTWNINIGGEYFFKTWLALRFGVYTNNSSHAEIPDNPTERLGRNIDMLGYSLNAAIYTSPTTSVTLGGYYTGGTGHATEQSGQKIKKIKNSIQMFSFLVGTAFYF